MDEETDSLAQPDAAQASPASEDSSLEEILAQFEAEVPPETRTPYEPDRVSYEEHARELNRSSELSADLENARKQLDGQMVANFEAEETIRNALKVIDQMQRTQDFHRDIGHFNSIVNNANDIVKEVAPHLPPDFAQRWLLAEAQMNPELRARFDNAHNSPADRAKAESYIKRTLLRFRKEIAAQPDPQISADIMAVTHAVRGASNKVPVAGRPDYAIMSNAAFNQHVKSQHGFDPGV